MESKVRIGPFTKMNRFFIHCEPGGVFTQYFWCFQPPHLKSFTPLVNLPPHHKFVAEKFPAKKFLGFRFHQWVYYIYISALIQPFFSQKAVLSAGMVFDACGVRGDRRSRGTPRRFAASTEDQRQRLGLPNPIATTQPHRPE